MAVVEVAREASTEATGDLVTRSHFDTALALLEPDGQYVRFVVVDDNNVQMEVNLTLRDATKLAAGILNVVVDVVDQHPPTRMSLHRWSRGERARLP